MLADPGERELGGRAALLRSEAFHLSDEREVVLDGLILETGEEGDDAVFLEVGGFLESAGEELWVKVSKTVVMCRDMCRDLLRDQWGNMPRSGHHSPHMPWRPRS